MDVEYFFHGFWIVDIVIWAESLNHYILSISQHYRIRILQNRQFDERVQEAAAGPFFSPKGDNGAVVSSIGIMAKPNVVTATGLAEHLCEFEIGCRVYDEGLFPPC